MKYVLDETRSDLAKLFTGTGVEIGVADGWYSTRIMELGLVDKLYGVDPYIPHQGYRDYTRETTFNKLKTNAHAQLDKYPNYEFIQDYSLEAVKRFEDNSLDWVYIDGDHSYKGVMEDMTAWWPKVKPGGIMAGDDYMWADRDKRFYDVIPAVNDFIDQNNIPEFYVYAAGRTPSNWMVKK